MYVDTSSSITTSLAGVTSAKSQKSAASEDSLSGFDSQDFMLLLLAQLKYQNPLEPMKNEEFMSQITQLNSLNELQSIDTSIKSLSSNNALSSAVDMIGKKVTLSDGTSDTVTGILVDGQQQQVMLKLGTLSVSVLDVVSVDA
jgi:flagellar basal-body rod modification protein FlgD